jgi:pimeloyl-ACP methyl ester carboxylesterase
MPTVTLNAGTIHYEKSGPTDGRPVVFVHGYAMGGSLWRALTERLAARGFSCIAPTWPLGAHTEPIEDQAALTMEGVAAMVSELLDALKLEDVVLVGNDTGGAIAQIVATGNPARLGALVLTSCDAFEHFPPPILKPLITAARFAPTFRVALTPLRTRIGRARGYGALAHADIDQLVAEWLAPALSDAKIREDLRRVTPTLNRATTVRAGELLTQFTKPALIAWSEDDAFFPLADGHRLTAALPTSRLEVIHRSKTFSMIDQPDVLAELIAEFAASGAPERTTEHGNGSPAPVTHAAHQLRAV